MGKVIREKKSTFPCYKYFPLFSLRCKWAEPALSSDPSDSPSRRASGTEPISPLGTLPRSLRCPGRAPSEMRPTRSLKDFLRHLPEGRRHSVFFRIASFALLSLQGRTPRPLTRFSGVKLLFRSLGAAGPAGHSRPSPGPPGHPCLGPQASWPTRS